MLLPRGVLKLAMCAASERTRYAMDGLAIERDDSGRVKVTATDGKRLVRAELAPMTDAARVLGATFGIEDKPGRIPLIVLPTRDETDRKGNVTALGLLSVLRDERKARDKGKATGPRKPSKPEMTALPKRPKLPRLPSIPRFKDYTAREGESIDALVARVTVERNEARQERGNVKAERARIIEDWKGVRRAVKSQNAGRKAEYKASIATWKAACIEARRARDVVAFDLPRESGMSACAVALNPGRVRELRALEGHYPPVDDVIPKANRAHRFELIIDTRALALIVDAWRALLRADERCELGEHADGKSADELSGIVLEMEGRNAVIKARSGGKALSLSESQRESIERWMRVISGEGKMSIGLNAFLLSEMAESLNAAIGKPGRMTVRLGIKSESDAVLVAPCAEDENTGEMFAPSVGGVTVTGVLMPINLG